MSGGNNYGLNRYKQTSISTASRGQIVIMLYEGCIKFLRKAIEALQAKNIADKGLYIGKAQDIINELNNSLNHEVGGDISRELEKLYNFLFEHTTEANIKNEIKPLESSIKILETLLDGWRAAVAQSGNMVMSTLTSPGEGNNTNGNENGGTNR